MNKKQQTRRLVMIGKIEKEIKMTTSNSQSDVGSETITVTTRQLNVVIRHMESEEEGMEKVIEFLRPHLDRAVNERKEFIIVPNNEFWSSVKEVATNLAWFEKKRTLMSRAAAAGAPMYRHMRA